MLLDLVKVFFAAEAAALRRMRRRAMLTGLAMVVFAFAFGFAVLALFLGLAEAVPGWLAALLMAAIGGAIGAVILLVARGRRRYRPVRPAAMPPEPIVSDVSRRRPDPNLSIPAVSAALAAGIFLGRNLPK